jgi:hypothetical protein
VTANFAYALVQMLHNFGAVAVVGSPAAAWLWAREHRAAPAVLAWLVAAGWLVQALSGTGFAVVSHYSRGELPEVAGVALLALYVKVGCAAGSLGLVAYYLTRSAQSREKIQRWIWASLFAAGVAALSGAAVLRWYG